MTNKIMIDKEIIELKISCPEIKLAENDPKIEPIIIPNAHFLTIIQL